MIGQRNITSFKTARKRKRLRWFRLVLGILAIGGAGAMAGHYWQQPEQAALPTVKAFTPGSPGYRETAASVRGPGGYRVIDGDMIEAPFGVKYRLLGFDTPEIFHSKCDA